MKPNFKSKLKPVRRRNGFASFFIFCLLFTVIAFAAYYCLSPNDRERLNKKLVSLRNNIEHMTNKTQKNVTAAIKPKAEEKSPTSEKSPTEATDTAKNKDLDPVRLPTQKLNPTVSEVISKADNYFTSHRFVQSFQEYKKVLTMDAKDQSDKKIAYAHHQLGMLSIMTNSPKTAIDEFELAAEIDPKSSQIQNNLGLTYQTVGEPETALNHFERAFYLDPKSTDAAVNLSNLLCQQNNYARAEAVLKNCSQHNPDSAKLHNNLGTVLCSQNKYLESMGEFEKAISIDPAMASAHYGLGFSMMKVKDYMPAIKEFKQALSLNGQLTEASSKIQQAYRQAVLVNTASSN